MLAPLPRITLSAVKFAEPVPPKVALKVPELMFDALIPVKDAPLPTGGTLVVVGEPQKLAMQTGDTVSVVASVATAADVVISTVELT